MLQMGSPVLAPDFQAKVVLSNGKTVPFHLNRKNFFTGHLAGIVCVGSFIPSPLRVIECSGLSAQSSNLFY